MKSLVRIAVTAALTLTTLAGVSTAANASTVSQCPDRYQVGNTAYINDAAGNHVASVKQFWSPMCAQNFAYIYAWQSFRDTHTSWSFDVAEVLAGPNGDDFSEGEQYIIGTRNAELWSHGYSGGGKCTYAWGVLDWDNYTAGAETDTRCG